MDCSQGLLNAEPFKAGDNVWPRSVTAEISGFRTLRLKAKVQEIECGRMEGGQDVRAVINPCPKKPFTGKLASDSPLTGKPFEEGPPMRTFRASRDLTARPSVTVPMEPARRGDVSLTISADGALKGGTLEK
jgi:hypothetical protein